MRLVWKVEGEKKKYRITGSQEKNRVRGPIKEIRKPLKRKSDKGRDGVIPEKAAGSIQTWRDRKRANKSGGAGAKEKERERPG